MTENGYYKGFAINGFTTCKLKHNNKYVVYHANPNVYGKEWYDFCMVDFDDDMCLARIHGFLQYKTSGLPTNVLLGDGKSVEEIAASSENDYFMYIVIHVATKHLNYSKIEENFITLFQLGNNENYYYLVIVDSIVGQLMVKKVKFSILWHVDELFNCFSHLH